MTNETSRARDYKHEYAIRQKKSKRLHADMEREKAEAFQAYLQKQGLTYIRWLNNKIDEELKA
jgi:hypothetical protein